jgi:hypothetical protein
MLEEAVVDPIVKEETARALGDLVAAGMEQITMERDLMAQPIQVVVLEEVLTLMLVDLAVLELL